MKFLIFSIVFGSFSIIAAVQNNYCELQKTPEYRKVRTNDFPSYFFKVSPDGKHIGYIDIYGNRLLDIATGKTFPLPGMVDPVFSPDGKLLVVPMRAYEFEGHVSFSDKMKLTDEQKKQNFQLSFYNANEFVNYTKKGKWPTNEEIKQQHSNALYRDNRSFGAYQSIGVIGKDEYRIVTDEKGVMFRNYKMSNGSLKADSKFYKPCKGIPDFPTDLPMLSKDGKFLSVFDESGSGTTKIYSIGENQKCHLALDLGTPTGKVAFDYETKQITFHIDQFQVQDGQPFLNTSGDTLQDVYIVKLDEFNKDGEITLIPNSWAKVSNNIKRGNTSYYPVFDKNGDVFYLQDIENQYEFVQVKTQDLKFKPFSRFPKLQPWKINEQSSCFELDKEDELQFVLGKLWSQVCQYFPGEYSQHQQLFSLSLTSESCEKLVIDNWSELSAQEIKSTLGVNYNTEFINSIHLKDLLAACPESNYENVKTKTIGEWGDRGEKKFAQVIQQKCLGCHNKPMVYEKEVPLKIYYDENDNQVEVVSGKRTYHLPIFPLEVKDVELSDLMVEAIGNKDPRYKMPKGGSLSDEEIDLFFKMHKVNLLSKPADQGRYLYWPFHLSRYSDEAVKKLMDQFEADIPKATRDRKRKLMLNDYRLELGCRYQQKDCKKAIRKMVRKRKRELGKNITKEALDVYIKDLKCEFGFEIDQDECR
jgi:hypothetical protein